MEYRKFGNDYIVRIAKGEEILSHNFVKRKKSNLVQS